MIQTHTIRNQYELKDVKQKIEDPLNEIDRACFFALLKHLKLELSVDVNEYNHFVCANVTPDWSLRDRKNL